GEYLIDPRPPPSKAEKSRAPAWRSRGTGKSRIAMAVSRHGSFPLHRGDRDLARHGGQLFFRRPADRARDVARTGTRTAAPPLPAILLDRHRLRLGLAGRRFASAGGPGIPVRRAGSSGLPGDRLASLYLGGAAGASAASLASGNRPTAAGRRAVAPILGDAQHHRPGDARSCGGGGGDTLMTRRAHLTHVARP